MVKLVNKVELAELLDKSERTLTTWQKNGMPIEMEGRRGAGNKYNVAKVVEWLIRRETSKLTVSDDGTVHDYEAERARLTHHQANKTELEAQVLKGKLIPSETVERVQGDMVSAFRAKMLSLPTKTAGKVQNLTELAEIEEALRQEVYESLTELSDYEPKSYGVADVQANSSDSSATAETDG